MGMLFEGVWTDDSDVAKADPDGTWRRTPSVYRNWITPSGEPGPTGIGGFTPDPGRYHLYAAYNCPWAHRVLLTRAVLGLEHVIDVSYVAPRRTDQGWVFQADSEFVDHLFDSAHLHDVYVHGQANYTGRVTVPLLWDRQQKTAVSNESADIVRMLNMTFRDMAKNNLDLYPIDHRDAIDFWNAKIHPNLNNGVYRAGFAGTQAAYDAAVTDVFETLDAIEEQLQQTPFLTGDAFTEADLRLFPTLARFDVAYAHAFKCNRNLLREFPRLWPYAKRIYAMSGVAETVRFDVYRSGYNSPSEKRNPRGIIPVPFDIDWS